MKKTLSVLITIAIIYSLANFNIVNAESQRPQELEQEYIEKRPVSATITGSVKTISGTIEIPIENAKMVLQKRIAQTYWVTVANTKTNTEGNYMFNISETGEYKITPTKQGFVFNPISRFARITNNIDVIKNFSARTR